MSTFHRRLASAVTIGALCLFVVPRTLAGTHAVQTLTATSNAPGARGRATLILRNASSGRLRVVTRGLTPQASFDLVIGGIKVASMASNPAGVGKVKLSTRPRSGSMLLGTDPRGQTIAVRDDAGDDDLEGTMPDDGEDAGDVACCLPDDNGSECDDKTPAECAAAGGTTPGAASCIPDPCGSLPPAGGVVCCIAESEAGAFVDDDPDVECEDDLSAAECANTGGTAVQAASCDPNPCAPVPPPQIVTCCVASGDETECEQRTPDHCAAAGGTASSATSCDPNPCGSTTPPDGDIRCCRPHDGGVECDEKSAQNCTADQGTNMGPGSCDPNPCM